MTTMDEAAQVAEWWVRGPMLVPLDEQLRILHAHSNDARRMMIEILLDDREWARLCVLGDDRLKASVDVYGDRSFRRTPEELRWELMQELADGRAYASIELEQESGR